jgi:hypothetical protein
VTVVELDEETNEEFERELPWEKIIPVKNVKPVRHEEHHDLMTGRPLEQPRTTVIPGRKLVSPNTEEYPEGRWVRTADVSKICILLENDDFGDLYLAPEGYSWR